MIGDVYLTKMSYDPLVVLLRPDKDDPDYVKVYSHLSKRNRIIPFNALDRVVVGIEGNSNYLDIICQRVENLFNETGLPIDEFKRLIYTANKHTDVKLLFGGDGLNYKLLIKTCNRFNIPIEELVDCFKQSKYDY